MHLISQISSFEIDVILDKYQTADEEQDMTGMFEIDVILDKYQTRVRHSDYTAVFEIDVILEKTFYIA